VKGFNDRGRALPSVDRTAIHDQVVCRREAATANLSAIDSRYSGQAAPAVVAPVDPMVTAGPVEAAAPVAPVTPGAPVAPVAPAVPIPVAPAAPVAPVVPVAPVAPVEPAEPVAPVAP
jgi:hypothetical protein